MSKRWILPVLLAGCLLLCGCQRLSSVPPGLEVTSIPGVSDPLPAAEAPESRRSTSQSTLWFRYADEAFLAPEYRTISHGLNETYELALVRALIAGPDVRSGGLRGLFPEGVQVTAASVSGRTLYVTFTEDLLKGYADEPSAWASDSYWSRESPLRRQLCMQSLAATLTENCDADRVQVMVQNAAGDVRRLSMGYYPETEGETLPAELLWRDEELLLTPGNTARIILRALAERDWQTLYLYVSAGDSRQPDYDDFVVAMEQLPALTACSISGGSITDGGSRITFTLQGTALAGGQTLPLENRVFRLQREGGVWKTTRELLQLAVEVTYE